MWKVKEVDCRSHKRNKQNNNIQQQRQSPRCCCSHRALHRTPLRRVARIKGLQRAVQAGSDAISFYTDKNGSIKGEIPLCFLGFPEFFGCSNGNWSFEYLSIHQSVYFLRYPNRLRRKLVLLQTVSSLASNILLSRSLILCKQLQLQHNTSSAMANVESACHKVIQQFQTTAGIFRNKYDKLKTAIVIRTIVLRPSCEKTLIAKLPNNGIPNQ